MRHIIVCLLLGAVMLAGCATPGETHADYSRAKNIAVGELVCVDHGLNGALKAIVGVSFARRRAAGQHDGTE